MVHETKLLTFWRSLNSELAQRGAEPVTLDTVSPLFEAQFTLAEAVGVLAPTIWKQRWPNDPGMVDWQRDFDAVFGGA